MLALEIFNVSTFGEKRCALKISASSRDFCVHSFNQGTHPRARLQLHRWAPFIGAPRLFIPDHSHSRLPTLATLVSVYSELTH
jgi:hypothetical protein